MWKITASFLASFKIGDNIHYNLEVLKTLYKGYNTLSKDRVIYLEKPITLILVAICEAIIYDFIKRSQWYTVEGVDGLTEHQLNTLRSSKAWSMDKKIKLFKQINLLGTSDDSLYELLDSLSKLRNRIHIQNEMQNFEVDEINAFTKARRVQAEKMVELLVKTISTLYPRPSHIKNSKYLEDFEFPWKEHFN